jgi:SAM-dependent methyltransferase
VILEAGSGAGRFTEILLQTGARVFSFDLSSAVESNRDNNGGSHGLTLFQASIFEIPLARHAFDKVICLGVIQHTPDPERAFKSLASHVRPGGEIVVDAYAAGLRNRLQWKYLLRPLTKRMEKRRLYRACAAVVHAILPLDLALQRHLGSWAGRLFPIASCSATTLPYALNKEWSILDTFDYYSPAHDHPQSIETVERWFRETGLEVKFIGHIPAGNRSGFVARGFRPLGDKSNWITPAPEIESAPEDVERTV